MGNSSVQGSRQDEETGIQRMHPGVLAEAIGATKNLPMGIVIGHYLAAVTQLEE